MDATTNEATKPEKQGAGDKKQSAAPRVEAAGAASATRVRKTLALDVIDLDEKNRPIDEESDSFRELLDSVRAFGVLNALQVQERGGGRYQLHDGHRRVRAARKAGLTSLHCEVWPENATADVMLASIAVQQHHEPHRAIHIARRLRMIKNEAGLTLEHVAARTGIPLDRVKLYQGLLQGSDDLLAFFGDQDVPLSIAVAMVRYEADTSEAKSRHLIARHKERPLTRDEINELRKRERARATDTGGAGDPAAAPAQTPRTIFARTFATALRKDPDTELPRLAAALEELGYKLVPIPPAACTESTK